MRSQKECIELLRGYFQNKAKDYGIVRMALLVQSYEMNKQRRVT